MRAPCAVSWPLMPSSSAWISAAWRRVLWRAMRGRLPARGNKPVALAAASRPASLFWWHPHPPQISTSSRTPITFLGSRRSTPYSTPTTLHVLTGHIQCAASELPFQSSEVFGGENLPGSSVVPFRGRNDPRIARTLVLGRASGSRSDDFFRSAEANAISIVAERRERAAHHRPDSTAPSAPLYLHEGAIYWHEGQQYLVESLDWEGGTAHVRAVAVDYYTEASQNTRIDIQQVDGRNPCPSVSASPKARC